MKRIGRATACTVVTVMVGLAGCETPGRSGSAAGARGGGGFAGGGGEAWTIECLALMGDFHRANAEQIAGVLRETPGINKSEVRVVNAGDVSRVFYGTYYRDIDRLRDERDLPPQLAADLALIRDLADGRGRRMFTAARMVPKPLEDVGPPEWNLLAADGVYTLQVGVFFPSNKVKDYKAAALAFVRELRSRGYEAYYYHTKARSMVTVGSFGPEAIRRSGDRSNVTEYSAKIRRMQRDELLQYNLTNGAVWYQIHEGQKLPVRSQLVRIPQEERMWRE